MYTIYIDADACKKLIRKYLIQFIQRKSNSTIKLVIVSNTALPHIPHHERISSIQTSNSPEATDTYIIANAKEGDLVITKDILLAQQLLIKNTCVINDNIEIYHKDTITARKQRAIYNAEQRNLASAFQLDKHIKIKSHCMHPNKERLNTQHIIAKFARYLNTWKQKR